MVETVPAKGKRQTLKDVVRDNTRGKNKLTPEQLSVLDDGTIGSMKTMMNGFNAKYPTGYIKVGQVDEIEQTELCSPIPKECIKIQMPKLVAQAVPDFKDLKGLINNVEPFRDMYNVEYSQVLNQANEADRVHERLSDLYGWNNGNECITIPQPKFYNVTRFKDLPCPYIDKESGRAFGWIVYKYCGSKSDNGHFKVNLSVRGRTTGKSGEEFMQFLHNLPQPVLTQPERRLSLVIRRSVGNVLVTLQQQVVRLKDVATGIHLVVMMLYSFLLVWMRIPLTGRTMMTVAMN